MGRDSLLEAPCAPRPESESGQSFDPAGPVPAGLDFVSGPKAPARRWFHLAKQPSSDLTYSLGQVERVDPLHDLFGLVQDGSPVAGSGSQICESFGQEQGLTLLLPLVGRKDGETGPC